ncbi:hypothetical protein [Nocardia concava]|uniref:hypothetical protein n=1 Tax=Nocardia concava TaxID=257281 RepID=UPI0002FC6424|nr:hypothetical protein [Nocardia concava]
MKSGTEGGDTIYAVEEPALVTALVAPLLKLRASLGSGARPDDSVLAALSAVTESVKVSDDTHRGGLDLLVGTDTAAAAHPVIKQTTTEIAGLAEVSGQLAPLLADAYTVRDKAADDLDTLISDFRAQATPLVKAARSQADLDPVVNLAADYTRSGVGVVKAATGQMDQYTGKVNTLAQDSPVITNPGTGQPGLAVPADDQPANSNYPNPGNTGQGGNTVYPNNSNYYGNTGYGHNSWNSNNGWNNNYGNNNTSYDGGSDYTNSKLAQTNPELAAQLTIQSALLSAGVTLGSALITGAVTLGSSLISSGAQVITTGIEKGETYAEKALAANTTQAGATPATGTPGTTTLPGGNSLTPGLADPGPATPATDQGGGQTPKPAASLPSTSPGAGTTPQTPQPQAGVPGNNSGGGGAPAVIPPGVQAKPQPDQDTKKRDGQAGTTA